VRHIGHGDTRVTDAIAEQASRLPYTAPGMTNNVRAIASKLLADISPGGRLTKILFTLGGADANENAIKLARGSRDGTRFWLGIAPIMVLPPAPGSHGATSSGGVGAVCHARRRPFPGSIPVSLHVPSHEPRISEADFAQDYLNHLEEIIQYEDRRRLRAILVEAVTGTNGVIIPRRATWPGSACFVTATALR